MRGQKIKQDIKRKTIDLAKTHVPRKDEKVIPIPPYRIGSILLKGKETIVLIDEMPFLSSEGNSFFTVVNKKNGKKSDKHWSPKALAIWGYEIQGEVSDEELEALRSGKSMIEREAVRERKREAIKKVHKKRDPSKSNKAQVYLKWKGGEKDIDKLWESTDGAVKRQTISIWMNWWGKGKSLPAIAEEKKSRRTK